MKLTKHEGEVIETRKNGTTQTKLNTFTCFPQLPIELRQKIWTCSANVPRNVDLLIKKGKCKEEAARGFTSSSGYKIISRSPYPALLSVCHESRYLGLIYYKLEFGTYDYQTSIPYADVVVLEPPQVYVNWSVDRLCMINAAASSFYHEALAVILERAGTMKAKSIAVNVHPRLSQNTSLNRRNLTRFAIKAGADKILVVCQAPMSNRHAVIDDARRINWKFKDFKATDSQNQQHSVLTNFVNAFQVLIKMEGMSWEKVRGLNMGKMMRETVVRTQIRTCNECPQMVYAAAASRKGT